MRRSLVRWHEVTHLKASTHGCAVHVLHRSRASYEHIFFNAQTHAVLLLQPNTVNQILLVFARTQREYCARFIRVFTFKFVFTKCAPDSSVKNYVRINHILSYINRKLIYYTPRMHRMRMMQQIHGTVVRTGFNVASLGAGRTKIETTILTSCTAPPSSPFHITPCEIW